MGTHGRITFVFNGKRIKTYNHFDSYPGGLGIKIANDIINLMQTQHLTLEQIRDLFENLRIVYEDSPVTPKDIEAMDEYRFKDTYYPDNNFYYEKCILRHYLTIKCQGSIEKILASGILYCCDWNDLTWKYEVDFDAGSCKIFGPEGDSLSIPFDMLTPQLMRHLEDHWGEPIDFHA